MKALGIILLLVIGGIGFSVGTVLNVSVAREIDEANSYLRENCIQTSLWAVPEYESLAAKRIYDCKNLRNLEH